MAQPKHKKTKPGRPKGSPTKSASFRLPEDLLEKLQETAEGQDRSQTTIVRRALERFLSEQEGARD